MKISYPHDELSSRSYIAPPSSNHLTIIAAIVIIGFAGFSGATWYLLSQAEAEVSQTGAVTSRDSTHDGSVVEGSVGDGVGNGSVETTGNGTASGNVTDGGGQLSGVDGDYSGNSADGSFISGGSGSGQSDAGTNGSEDGTATSTSTEDSSGTDESTNQSIDGTSQGSDAGTDSGSSSSGDTSSDTDAESGTDEGSDQGSTPGSIGILCFDENGQLILLQHTNSCD